MAKSARRTRVRRKQRKQRKTRRRPARKQHGGAEDTGPTGYEAVVVGKMPMVEGKLDDPDSVPVALSGDKFKALQEAAD